MMDIKMVEVFVFVLIALHLRKSNFYNNYLNIILILIPQYKKVILVNPSCM